MTAPTLFISDLHLSAERPAAIGWFTRFLETDAADAAALYILGDLFDYWIGDDAIDLLDQTSIIEALRTYSAAHDNVFFLPGNRDFLVGETFTELTGCVLLTDETVVELQGEPALLMHGDSLCTDDIEHQNFRRLVLDPEWQRTFLGLPLQKRYEMALDARAQSDLHKSLTTMEIMDVTPAAVAEVMLKHNVRRLIHGHTHRPAVHQVALPDRTGERIVLGDWYSGVSVLKMGPSDYELISNSAA